MKKIKHYITLALSFAILLSSVLCVSPVNAVKIDSKKTQILDFAKSEYGTWEDSYFSISMSSVNFRTAKSTKPATIGELKNKTLGTSGLLATVEDAVKDKPVYASKIATSSPADTAVVSILKDTADFTAQNTAFKLSTIDFGYLIPSTNGYSYIKGILYDYTDSQNFKAFCINKETDQYTFKFFTVTDGSASVNLTKSFKFTEYQSEYCNSRYVNIRIEYSTEKTTINFVNADSNTSVITVDAPAAATNPTLGFTCCNYKESAYGILNYAIVDGITVTYEQSKADAFKAGYADVLALNNNDFAVKNDNYYKNETRLKAAISAYESLSETEKTVLTAEKAKLDELAANIDLNKTAMLDFTKSEYGTWEDNYFNISMGSVNFKTVKSTSFSGLSEIKNKTLGTLGLSATAEDAVKDKPVYASKIATTLHGDTAVVSVLKDTANFTAQNTAFKLKAVDFGYLIPGLANYASLKSVIYDYTDSQNFKAFCVDKENNQYTFKFLTVTDGSISVDSTKSFKFTEYKSEYCNSLYVNIRIEYSAEKTTVKFIDTDSNTAAITVDAPAAATNPTLGFTCCNYKVTGTYYGLLNYAIVDGITMTYATTDSETPAFTMDMHKGAYIYTGEPSNLRFGVNIVGDSSAVNVIEYGMIFMPTDKVGDDGLTVGMENSKNSNGAKGYFVKKTGTALTLPEKYYGLLTGIAKESDVNGKYISRAFTTRAYIKYTLTGDAVGTYRVAYSDLSYSRSLYGTALRAAKAEIDGFATDYADYITYIAASPELDFENGVTSDQINAAGSAALSAVWEKYSNVLGGK